MNNKVLLLGAGLVSKPLAIYLLEHGFNLTVASRTLEKAENLVKGYSNGKAVKWVVAEEDKLNKMIQDNDLIISLLPYIYHLKVAKACIKHEKHLVTTSYVKEEMAELDKEVREKNLLFLNEIGVDPGIDHMSAMKIFDDIWDKDGEIVSFNSYCGALPAPEAADNPLKYKFAWSPRGVLLAGRNSGRYLKDGKTITIEPKNLFDDHHPIEINEVGTMEYYPNRDSISYIDTYNLNNIKTMFRGTLRYPGWSELMSIVSKSGWLSLDEVETNGLSYKGLTARLSGLDEKNIKKQIAKKFNIENKPQIIDKMEWMGLFSDKLIDEGKIAPIDILTNCLYKKMYYEKGERDMVVLLHKVEADISGERKLYTSLMVDYGVEGEETSIARTVALPAAIATRLILEGKIKETGVQIPVKSEIYKPVLKELENIGIKFEETIKNL